MNQILETRDFFSGNMSDIVLKKRSKKTYFFVFIFSINICIILFVYLFFSYFSKINQQQTTLLLKEKYNLASLYQNSIANIATVKLSDNISIIGLLEIPTLSISYPILENSNEDLLKISVCRFAGPLPNRKGNLCIAGHNYKNTSMFSKLGILKTGDSIFVTDLNNVRLEYIVYKKQKVKENEWECTANTPDVQITLMTCLDTNNKERIIIKAKTRG